METKAKRLTVGIFAHVDAGKTTLSEAFLYVSGAVRKQGRVDHGDAFLDNFALERERGITIFSKQAVFSYGGVEFTLVDTPGHVDFAAEAERTLEVLDCAVLVVSATDGVQGHTLTLWRLLERSGVPVVLFINKTDLAGADATRVLAECSDRFGACVDFSLPPDELAEELAVLDEDVMARYLETGGVPDEDAGALIASRRVFPCWCGAALRLDGVRELLDGIARYMPEPLRPAEFGARVYKITYDAQGTRLTHLKVTGGALAAKTMLSGRDAQGRPWTEKADRLLILSGAKSEMCAEAPAGTLCAVTGLTHTFAGEGLGFEAGTRAPMMQPVLEYRVILPDGTDAVKALACLRRLEEEDPQLCVAWNEQSREIGVRLMGEVQLEVLARVAAERFGLEISFGEGTIVYKETISAPVEGAGHFEPLRHYAEVHLLLEPAARGSGITYDTVCSEDALDRNWQRLILSCLAEKQHTGVLTGAPLTDVKITLTAGRAHLKHTEGGDFREAACRAVRQGLRKAQSVLLEPVYEFRLEVPADCVGRAMADIGRMDGSFEAPVTQGDAAVITGTAPVASMRGYPLEVAAYTKGRGRILCSLKGYEPCRNADEVIAAAGYDADADVDNTADSVFCSHGAGRIVPWNEADAMMHVESGIRLAGAEQSGEPQRRRAPERSVYRGTLEEDKELEAIFTRTYGAQKPRSFDPPRRETASVPVKEEDPVQDYLLVDGYNIIFAWDELRELAKTNIDGARAALIDILCNYQGFRKCEVIVVFDAYKVRGGLGQAARHHNIWVVYTKEAETADMYIEKTTYELGRRHRVRVATSDGAEQLIILGHGALRISARSFYDEVRAANQEIREILQKLGAKRR